MVKKVIFLALLLIGIFFRIYQVTSLPAGLFLDEVNMAVDAKTLVENGTDQYGRRYPFTFEDVTDFKLPVYVYGTAIVYAFLGPQLITVRLLALIASLLSIFSFGYLTKLLFKERRQLPYLIMVVIALSPFAIHFARIGYETTLATFLISIFLISFLKSCQDQKSARWYILGILSATLATWTYPAARFIVPVFTFALFILSFLSFRNMNSKKVRFSSILFFVFCILSFIPTLIFSPTANSRSLEYIFYGTEGSGISLIITKIMQVISSVVRLWNLEFLFDKGDTFAYRHGTKEVGIFFSLFIFPYIVGLIYTLRKANRRNFFHAFITVFTLVCCLPSALTSSTPYGTRIVPLLLPYSLLIALGLEKILKKTSLLGRVKKVAISVVIMAIFFYQLLFFYHVYFIHFRITGAAEFSSAPTQLGQYLATRRQLYPQQLVYFLNDKSCRNWGQDTLHLWYFSDLSNKELIVWNNLFREKRYGASVSPFDAYDQIKIPTFYAKKDNIILYPGYISNDEVPAGSLFVRCGFQLGSYDTKREKLLKVFYLSSEQEMDPYYVITQKTQ